MRNLKKIGIVLLALLNANMLPACARTTKQGEEKIDKAKSQLYVGNYNGGFGDEWLLAAKKRFEDQYAEVSFEENKLGVQVVIDNEKDDYLTDTLLNTMNNDIHEVFFTQGSDTYYQMVNNNMILDITDIVTENLGEKFNENRTIEEKLNSHQQGRFKINNKYYGLPHFNGFEGIVYDIDLFNSKNLFFDDKGELGKKNTDSGLGTGPDGVSGTYDDGLPATYAQFYKLCDEMYTVYGITPISWNGTYKETYTKYLTDALFYDYEGYDSGLLMWNGGLVENNKTKLVSSIGSDGIPVLTDEIAIGIENYADLNKQAGRYYSLSFFDTIIKNGWFYSKSLNTLQSHLMAQADFLWSRYDSSMKPIAMIIEGNWWENEASATFDSMVEDRGEQYSRKNRNFGFMPMPKVDETHLGEATLFDMICSISFINANIASSKVELAKTFMQFVHTDVSLSEFTRITGSPKALEYDIDEEIYEELSSFSKTIWNLKNSSKTIYAYYSDAETRSLIRNIPIEGDSFINNFYYDNMTAVEVFKKNAKL